MTRKARTSDLLMLATLDDARRVARGRAGILPIIDRIAAAGDFSVKTADTGALAGEWDPNERVIWLHHDLLPEARRCTLIHELIHAARDDDGLDDAAANTEQERLVHQMASQFLVDLADIAISRIYKRTLPARARWIGVDLDTFRTRLGCLEDWERDYLTGQGVSVGAA